MKNERFTYKTKLIHHDTGHVDDEVALLERGELFVRTTHCGSWRGKKEREEGEGRRKEQEVVGEMRMSNETEERKRKGGAKGDSFIYNDEKSDERQEQVQEQEQEEGGQDRGSHSRIHVHSWGVVFNQARDVLSVYRGFDHSLECTDNSARTQMWLIDPLDQDSTFSFAWLCNSFITHTTSTPVVFPGHMWTVIGCKQGGFKPTLRECLAERI